MQAALLTCHGPWRHACLAVGGDQMLGHKTRPAGRLSTRRRAELIASRLALNSPRRLCERTHFTSYELGAGELLMYVVGELCIIIYTVVAQ